MSNTNSIGVIGAPYDKNSTFLRGPALAPARIREALYCESANMSTESCRDLGQVDSIHLLDDLEIHQFPDDIERGIGSILDKFDRVITLGGDHSITYPVIKAFSRKYKKLNILHLDAHCDLYHFFDNNHYSHASPFARIMEEQLAQRLVQVGIRTLTPHQKEQAEKFNVEIIDMNHWENIENIVFDGPVYLSLDIDVLDPAFAPGISHYEPGGATTRQVIQVIQNIKATLVGADIVELNPARDISDMTAMVAAKFLKEIIDRML
ncbi:agmatinase [Fulvivirgaceae bacterium BMA10]|uniref:Agmatinase n=1 Tax=Splendidivirga corallicola TaxID=3051826 RepID=A0ABT8KY19_9BACT|nr:agmatinase [Fulvivirgaceae bacterium BMA10]